MEKVIDASVAHGIEELLAERALATDALQQADIAQLRALMDEARARRLQPHYIEGAFRAAFTRLGGKIRRREQGRFEITHVPAQLRTVGARPDRHPLRAGHVRHRARARRHRRPRRAARARATRCTTPSPTRPSPAGSGRSNAAPSSSRRRCEEPRLLVGVIEEIADATETAVARRFGYAYIDEHGAVEAAGPAPYLDCVAAPADERRHRGPRAAVAGAKPRSEAASWIIANQLPAFLSEVKLRREAELHRVRDQVERRLDQESNRLILEAMVAQEQEQAGKKPKESHDEPDVQGGRPRGPAHRAAGAARPPAPDAGQAPAGRHRRARAAAGGGGGRDPRRRADARRGDEGGRAPRRRPRARDRARARPHPGRAGVQQPRLRRPVPARRRGPDPDRGQGPHRRRRGLLRHPQRGADGAQQRAALPPRARARRPARRPSTTRSATSRTRSAASTLGDFDATGHRGKWDTTWARGREPF